MLKEIKFPPTFEYRSGSDHEPVEFFFEAFLESNKLELLLGYFSSSAIRVLSLGFASFIANGGVATIIINQYLSAKDKKILQHGVKSKEEDFDFNISNIQKIKSSLEDNGIHFFECLAWLIASKRLIIQSIKPSEGFGISHYKSGIFSDGKDKVKFKGSCNFTYSGLIENLEELDVKPSWGFKNETFVAYSSYFKDILNGKIDDIELVDTNSIIEVIESFGSKDLDELLEDEKRLIKFNKSKKGYGSLKNVMIKAEEKIHFYQISPRFPFESEPRDYQKEAFDNWVGNNYQGIFAMATGTGKTITALNCVLNDFLKNDTYKAVILVPTNVLVQQWEEEANKFNFREVIKVSSKYKGWQSELDRILTQINFGIDSSFIIISTYATFTKQKFQDYFKRLPSSTLFIADEAHNIGSPGVTKILKNIHLGKKVGLSATPKRIYDPEGSSKMEDFFHDKEPYTYSFSMEKAIDEGILCQYYYYPKLVSLTEDELDEYVAITERLVKFFNFSKNKLEKNSIVEKLLLERKRIIHKAKNKLQIFKEILFEIEKKHKKLDYTLVYAPEGYFSDDNYITDGYSDLSEENRIIDFYSNTIRTESPETTIAQYVSDSQDKEFVLDQFSNGKLNVLLSMKCLDEGVDIPRTEKAIFCSSTGNPRQFIQRRGRILRKHPDKRFAYVYDMVVIPRIDFNSKKYQLERKMVQKELERVVHFGYMALNKYDSIQPFDDICNYYQLNLDTIHNELI